MIQVFRIDAGRSDIKIISIRHGNGIIFITHMQIKIPESFGRIRRNGKVIIFVTNGYPDRVIARPGLYPAGNLARIAVYGKPGRTGQGKRNVMSVRIGSVNRKIVRQTGDGRRQGGRIYGRRIIADIYPEAYRRSGIAVRVINGQSGSVTARIIDDFARRVPVVPIGVKRSPTVKTARHGRKIES